MLQGLGVQADEELELDVIHHCPFEHGFVSLQSVE